MKDNFKVACAALLLLVTAPMAWAEGWIRAESEHFVATSDGAEQRVSTYLRSLESLHHVMQLLLGVEANKAQGKSKFELYLLNDQREMDVVRPGFANKFAGAYLINKEGSTGYVVLVRSDMNRVGDPGLAILFHEYAHNVMFQHATMTYPAWYVEGFADYFGSSEIIGNKVVLGIAPRWVEKRLRNRPWIGFEDVLKPKFHSTGDADADDQYLYPFYAQSWLLAHYALSDSERLRRFNDYFKRIGAGEDPVAAFEPAIGIPVNKLAGVLKRYLDVMSAIEVSPTGMPKADISLENLPVEADRYLLEASVLKTLTDKAHGQTLLERLRAIATQGPRTEGLDLALARAELFFGKADVGTAMLQKLAAENEDNFEAQYLLGRALEKSAETLSGDKHDAALAQARAQFFKAYRLKKNDAPNLYHLARMLARDGATPNALNAAQGAHALAPAVPDYAYFEAQLDLKAGQAERALRTLAPLASNPHDLKFAARIREAMAAIRAGKSWSDVQALLTDKP